MKTHIGGLTSDKEIKKAYAMVIKDLKTKYGKKCKSYAVGCYLCQVHRMAEDLQSIVDTTKV